MSSHREPQSFALQRRARSCVWRAGSLASVLLLGCGGKTHQVIENDSPIEMESPIEVEPPEAPEPLPVPACTGDSPFSDPRPIELDPIFSIAGAWLSADRLELIIGARVDTEVSATDTYDLMRAERSNIQADFDELSPLEELNTPLLERNPTLTPDGLTIYFESDRSGESSDIYVADRSGRGAPFGEARLVAPVSTKRNDVPGAVSLFSNSLYFSADRLGGPGKENLYFAARQENDTFGETFLISSVDSDDSNVAPTPNADELALYFSSNRNNADLSYDVYRTRREAPGAVLGLPLVVPELSSSASDVVAWLSADECHILLTRETPPGSGHVVLFEAVR